MPKVTDEYLIEKKNCILECVGEILKEKPLYMITMRDIIKKAGFSQGVIYRYYANLDEIYVDYINLHTSNNLLEQRIEAQLKSGQACKSIIAECLTAIGVYIEELMKSVVGKTFFELTVLYACDFEKRTAVFPKLKFKQSLEYAQQKIAEYILGKTEQGVLRTQFSMRSIVMFVSSFIDGVAQGIVINDAKNSNHSFESVSYVAEMFQALAKAVIGFFEE